jgi:hypothetical protein
MEETVNATANELGAHRWVAGWVQAYPEGPWPVGRIKDVMAFDPDFRLLWVTNVWKTPNDGIVKTGSFMTGREVKNPFASKAWIKRLRLSQHKVSGVRYTRFTMHSDILDGLTEEERNLGALPRFVPFTSQDVESLRRDFWRTRNMSQAEEEAEANKAAEEAEHKALKAIVQDRDAEKRERALHNRVKAGKAARTFVSDSLIKLREAAGISPGMEA